jgi:hypothetical protein
MNEVLGSLLSEELKGALHFKVGKDLFGRDMVQSASHLNRVPAVRTPRAVLLSPIIPEMARSLISHRIELKSMMWKKLEACG